LKIGVFAYQFRSIEFEQFLQVAQHEGISAVELGVAGHTVTPGFESDRLLKDSERRSEIVDLLGRYEMKISALNAMCNPLDPDLERRQGTLNGLRQAIRLAAEIGVDRIVTGAGCPGVSEQSQFPSWIVYPFSQMSFDHILEWQWREVVRPQWRELAAFARDHSVRVCIELHPGTVAYNTESFLRLQDITGDVVGVNFDPSHLFWQGMDPRVVIRALGHCIYHAHAKDVIIREDIVARNGVLDTNSFGDWQKRSWSFCCMGDGHDAVFWRSVVTALRTVGYDDVWSIEYSDPIVPPLEGLKRNACFLKRII
jgi:sugar phosphate isomerase/epimerase